MSEFTAGRCGLGHQLSGIQHVGVTVDDLAKSLEFYVEVLGGRLALSGDGFAGARLHHTLFQRECLDAAAQGASASTLGVPPILSEQVKLDVRLISFGSTLVELLHFRDGQASPAAPGALPPVPSSVGFNCAVHICFAVREEIDLNQFALDLEEECCRRGIGVSCNRIVEIRSESERRAAPARFAANKFWNDPRYPAEGVSDEQFGDFQGLGFFYCKGPSGEQLEFAQATRKARERMAQAQASYAARGGI